MSDQGQAPNPSSSLSENIESAAESVRRYSPALFGVIAIAFLLPFISVQCAGQNVTTIDGLDLIIGGEIAVDPGFEESMDFGDDFDVFEETDTAPTEDLAEADRVEPNIFAITSLAAAVIGLVLAMAIRSRARAKFLAVASSLVVLGLIGLRFDAGGDTGGIPGAVEIKYRFGYWLALLVGLTIAVAHILEMRRKPESKTPTVPLP